jgi:diguanylate cyclase (GGDEF)-like protein/PAS domain S-box-containing protein
LQTTYDAHLVALSFVIASLASYVALDLAGRTTAARGRARVAWLACGAGAMGTGIWSMHFIGMLAFHLRHPSGHELRIGYDHVPLALSIGAAIVASAVALGIASRPKLTTRGFGVAGALLGAAIASMHYIGMAAMRVPAALSYSAPLVAASIAIAVVASIVAVALARRLGETSTVGERWAKRAAAAVMGVAIAGMHYTAMAAARFADTTGVAWVPDDSVVATDGLAIVITVAALLVLGVAFTAAALDRAHSRRLNHTMLQSEARYRSLTQAATDAIVSADAAGRIVSFNAAAERTFGYSEAEAAGRPLTILMPAAFHEVHARIAHLQGGDGRAVHGRTVEVEGVRRDGTVFPIELALSRWTADGETFFTGIIRDATERKRAETALRENELRFRNLVEHSPEAIVLHIQGELVYANPAAAAVLGFDLPAGMVGTRILDLVHPESHDLAVQRLERLDGGVHRAETIEYRLLHRDGRVLDVALTSVPGSFDGCPAVQTHMQDVTDRKALERQLIHQAFHDALTGLANRALFRDRVAHALARASRRQNRPAVLFLDLDNFKAVNDGLGHVAGDALLVIVGTRLVAALRGADTCARLGGDEFAVLIEEAGASNDIAADAAHIAERIIESFRAPISLDGAEVVVGVSIGIAIARDGEKADDLLRNADLAMYRAKGHGKGRYEVFEPAMHDIVRRRLDLETDLRRAVEWCALDEAPGPDSPFVLHYQPITTLDTGHTTGFEALVRWLHPERGLIPPLEFIPIAEETGLILPLGRWILATACRQIASWQAAATSNGPITLTVNISAVQLMRPELIADVATALEASGLSPERLVLELTESMLVDDSIVTLDRLRALKKLGVRIAIDDFGIGFSSLSYLERFPVDLLKIDKTFVDKIGVAGEGRDDSALARAVLGLGGALNMRVVAEGIETEAQWTRLVELGCELGQGYYFARPLPPEQITHEPRSLRTPPSAEVAIG